LNFADLRFLRPVKVEETKTFTFSSKKLFMSAQTTITAYTGGQKAKFIIHVHNESSSDVMSTIIELVRHVNYNSDEPKKKTKQKKECIKTSRYEGVVARTMKEIEAIFTIPSVAPTSDGSCRVLEISYSIKITALLGGLHSDPSLYIPIIIGTVPYFQAAIPIQNAEQTPNLLLNLNSARESIGWNVGASTSSNAFLPSAPVPTTPEDYDMRKIIKLL
jgi:Arrestin (or S-antigen), C-terminal domain